MKLIEIIITCVAMIFLDAIYLTLTSEYFNVLIDKIQGSRIQFKLSGAIAC